MCGRFGFAKGIDDFSKKFHIPMAPSYNIAPSHQIVAVDASLNAFKAEWSFAPSWSNKPIINARIETLDEKPSFKGYQKCLIPASGWYEWGMVGGMKVPYYLTTSEDWFFMGGIQIDHQLLILTKEADEHLQHVHHRMPLVFSNSYNSTWDINQIDRELINSIQPYTISNKINKVNYDREDLLTPADYPIQGNLF